MSYWYFSFITTTTLFVLSYLGYVMCLVELARYLTSPHHLLTDLLYFYMRVCKCQLFTNEGNRRLLKWLNYCFSVLASVTNRSIQLVCVRWVLPWEFSWCFQCKSCYNLCKGPRKPHFSFTPLECSSSDLSGSASSWAWMLLWTLLYKRQIFLYTFQFCNWRRPSWSKRLTCQLLPSYVLARELIAPLSAL